jgi:hypothetical protein
MRLRKFWDYGSGLRFSPRVRAVSRYNLRGETFVNVIVAARDAAHAAHCMPLGRRLTVRAGTLYGNVRAIPRTFGRLEYSAPITEAELASLPLATGSHVGCGS